MEKKKSLAELRKMVCEDKVIRVEPIIRPKPYLKRGRNGEPHDGEHTYTGCTKTFSLAWSIKKHSYMNPFFNDEEQEAFEKLLDQKEGSLNLYNFGSEFWGSFTVIIPKEGLELDLNNPADALRYRILKTDPKFATNAAEASIVEKQYLLVNEKEQKEQESILGAKKDKANDYMYKLKKSKKDMVNTLRLLGKKPDPNASADWLKAELYKIIDEVTTTKGMSGLDKFLAVLEDPRKEIKLFVLDAVDAGAIVKVQGGYKSEHDGKFLGRRFEDVVDYFSAKSPEVQEQMLIIKETIKN